MKVRMKQLDAASRADALAVFTRLVRETFTVLPVSRDDFREAARLADLHGLRAGEALHLGIVSNHGERLVSLDRVQVHVAVAAGISARLF